MDEGSFVQNDIVPRACLWGFEQLRLEVINSNWVEEYQRKVNNSTPILHYLVMQQSLL